MYRVLLAVGERFTSPKSICILTMGNKLKNDVSVETGDNNQNKFSSLRPTGAQRANKCSEVPTWFLHSKGVLHFAPSLRTLTRGMSLKTDAIGDRW